MAPDGTTTLGTPICVLVRSLPHKQRTSTSPLPAAAAAAATAAAAAADPLPSSHPLLPCQVRNKDQKSQDYTEMEQAYRPSHADATYDFKYGIRAVRE